jgi:hypothetical protein
MIADWLRSRGASKNEQGIESSATEATEEVPNAGEERKKGQARRIKSTALLSWLVMKVGEEVQQENFGQQEYRMWAGRGSGQGAAKRRGGAKRLSRRCTPLRFRVQYGTAAVERIEASVSWQLARSRRKCHSTWVLAGSLVL